MSPTRSGPSLSSTSTMLRVTGTSQRTCDLSIVCEFNGNEYDICRCVAPIIAAESCRLVFLYSGLTCVHTALTYGRKWIRPRSSLPLFSTVPFGKESSSRT